MRPNHPVRIATAAGATIGLALLGIAGAAPATASTGSCVGGPGCFSTVQAAVDAAPAGATIHIGPGTFRGGIVIRKALTLVGAGSGRTTLKGGDSVVKVTPTSGPLFSVVLSDLTLTGGVARGGTEDTFIALGGGLHVDGRDDGSVGPAVTIRRVVVAGNRAEPASVSSSPSGVQCPDGNCPFALTGGGGISSFGTLTIDHSVVRGNAATGHASDAQGGGVLAQRGALRIVDSTITGNSAEPKDVGRYAEGGGIFTESPSVRITGSTITGNSATLRTSWPAFPSADADSPIDMNANGGGVHIGDGAGAVVDRTTIVGNVVTADDPAGEPYAFSSGLFEGESTIAISRTVVHGNSLTARVKSSGDVGYSGNAVELDGGGTISDSAITGNRAEVGAADDAQASNGLSVFVFDEPGQQVTVRRTVIRGNTATARSTSGSAEVFGAGVLNDGLLDLDHVSVCGNRATAVAPHASARGGGIFNGTLYDPTTVHLRLSSTSVTGNAAVAKDGTAEGGGLFTTGADGVTYSLQASSIRGNAPDQIAEGAAG